MNIVDFLRKLSFLPERRLIELYPPFFFMGVKVLEISEDYRRLHVQLPKRWYGLNMHGSIFGGFIGAVSDPLPVLMCLKLFPGMQGYTKAHHVKFVKPARDALDFRIEIDQEAVDSIQNQIDSTGSATQTFHYTIQDLRGRLVAEVENTVFLRKKAVLAETLEKKKIGKPAKRRTAGQIR